MTIVTIGIERNAHEVVTPNLASAVAEILGPHGAVLLWYSGAVVNPSDGAWEWHSTDECIRNLNAAGLEVWLKLCGIPPRGTIEGKCTYGKYTDGPWSYKRDANGDPIPGSADLDLALDWVKNPAHVDRQWSYEIGRRSMDRYYTRPIQAGQPASITRLVNGNEIDSGTYWPPIVACSQDESFQRVTDELLLPFSAGVRASTRSTPRLPIMGPETAGDDGLRRMLAIEASLGGQDSVLFDIPTFHCYGEPEETLEAALGNLHTRMSILEPHRRGRKVGISETGDGGNGWIVEFHRRAIAEYGEIIDFITTHGWQSYMECLNPSDREDRRVYQPTSAGGELAAFIREHHAVARRRPSRA
jgi:hypothetical protein